MKNRSLLVLFALFFAVSVYGQNIWFVTSGGAETDQIDWLDAQGFDVHVAMINDEIGLINLPQDVLDNINAADLIIVGRMAWSTNFMGENKEYFNAIKAPVMLNSIYVSRPIRANWLNSNNQAYEDGADYITVANVLEPADPVFSGITLSDTSTFEIFSGPLAYLNMDITTVESNGTHLASCRENYPLITRFEPLVEFFPESGDFPSGYRTFFPFGSDQAKDPGGNTIYNYFPFTEEGKKVYLAEIQRMVALSAPPASDDASLVSLSTSPGIWVTPFDPEITDYTVVVPEKTSFVTIDGEAKNWHASVSGLGDVTTPATAVVTVTADDGTTRDYTLHIILEDPKVTFKVSLEDITDQEFGTDVWAVFGDDDSTLVITDPDGDKIYAGTTSFPAGTLVTYSFAYMNGPDEVANRVIETVPAECAGASGYREIAVPDSSILIDPIIYFGTCNSATVKGNITFQVDMNEVTDRDLNGQVWLVLGNWESQFNLADYDGDGVFSRLKSFDAGEELQYFFAYQNGANPDTDREREEIPALCADAEGYRSLTVPEGELELPAYGFGQCVASSSIPQVFFVAKSTNDDDQLNYLIDDPAFDVTVDRDHLSDLDIAEMDAFERQEAIDAMEEADIVVLGRGVWSTRLDEAEDIQIWNNITTPTLSVSPWQVRSSRLKWFNTTELRSLNDAPETLFATALVPEDSVFNDVNLQNNLFPFTTRPHDVLMIPKSTKTNGTMMAFVGDSIVLYARFSPAVEFYPGAEATPAGFRSYFGFGNDKLDDEFGQTYYNYFNSLSDDAKKVYRAELLRLAALGRMQMLSAITYDTGTLEPMFDPSVTEYTIVLPPDASTVTIGGMPMEGTSTVSGGGILSPSESTTLTVTGNDGSSTDYSVTVRTASTDATLSDLGVDVGTLDPVFDPGVYDYDVQAPEGTTYVNVVATANDPHAFIYGTGAVDVSTGAATANVIVTAEDGITTMGYTLNISVLNGIEARSARSLQFYPNPASDMIYLKDHAHADIQVYSISGLLLIDEQDVSSLDVGKLEPGSYILKATSKTGIRIGKLIIE
ncbi:MAG: cadherin-like beta sandwich domain-containing protein [Bacteroidota bacterium]